MDSSSTDKWRPTDSDHAVVDRIREELLAHAPDYVSAASSLEKWAIGEAERQYSWSPDREWDLWEREYQLLKVLVNRVVALYRGSTAARLSLNNATEIVLVSGALFVPDLHLHFLDCSSGILRLPWDPDSEVEWEGHIDRVLWCRNWLSHLFEDDLPHLLQIGTRALDVLRTGKVPNFELDPKSRQLRMGGAVYELTEQEVRILSILHKNLGERIKGPSLKTAAGSGERPDKIIAGMKRKVPALGRLISSQKGPYGGYRLDIPR